MASNDHFNEFFRIATHPVHAEQQQGSVGHVLSNFAQSICENSVVAHLPNKKLCRQDLVLLCRDPELPVETCFVAIMAWGGMRHDHARRAWTARDRWIQTLDKVRNNSMTRRESYRCLKEEMDRKNLPGVGPAYFTKLIHFLRKEPDGYILDQWTGRSINLFFEHPLVPLVKANNAFYVSSKTNDKAYEDFCSEIDRIADELKTTGRRVEELLFSKGGKKPHEWRRYVKNHSNRPNSLQAN